MPSTPEREHESGSAPRSRIRWAKMVSRPMDSRSCLALRGGTRRLFESSTVTIGVTFCPPWHPDFARPGPMRRHLFAFPSAPVWIERAGEDPFLADANRVVFHGEGDEIERRAVDDRGSRGNWFSIEEELLFPHLEERARGFRQRSPGPFRLRHGPSPGLAFKRQSLLVRELLAGDPIEPLRVEETTLALLDEVLASACGSEELTGNAGAETRRRHARLVEETKAWLGVHYRSAASLRAIASAVGASPFHLARVFRARTGLTLHAYLNQLRLRAALLAVLEGCEDLAQLALSLGFASHAHLTDVFRASFGCPPSALRDAARRPRARKSPPGRRS